MLEALRSYVQAASGLTELSRARAKELAASVVAAGTSGAIAGSVGQQASAIGGSVSQQVTAMAEELLAAGRSNRSALTDLIRAEVEAAVARVGLVPVAELSTARRRIADLEARVEELARASGESSSRSTARSAPGAGSRPASTHRRRPSRAAVARAAGRSSASAAPSTTAKRATANKPTANKATATKPTATKTTARTAVAKQTAKKAVAKKTPAKKTPAKKATATRKAGTVGRS